MLQSMNQSSQTIKGRLQLKAGYFCPYYDLKSSFSNKTKLQKILIYSRSDFLESNGDRNLIPTAYDADTLRVPPE